LLDIFHRNNWRRKA